MNGSRILTVDNREFVLTLGDVIGVYELNGQNYVEYKNNQFEIRDRYDLPKITDSTFPIRIEGTEAGINVSVNTDSGYCVEPMNREGLTVTEGRDHTYNVFERSVVAIVASTTGEADGERLTFHFEYIEDDDSPERNTEDVSLDSMYSEDSEEVSIYESEPNTDSAESQYFSNIHININTENVSELSHIGTGTRRDAYEINEPDKLDIQIQSSNDLVIKIASNEKGIESNRKEFQTWQAVKGTELEQYFAPVRNRGPNFRYVIMDKADKLIKDQSSKERSDIKYMLKDIFNDKLTAENADTNGDNFDIDYGNVGMFGNQPKVIDYPFGGNIWS